MWVFCFIMMFSMFRMLIHTDFDLSIWNSLHFKTIVILIALILNLYEKEQVATT